MLAWIATNIFGIRQVRRNFLALESAQQALAFFCKYGPFAFTEDCESRFGPEAHRLYEEQLGAPLAFSVKRLPELQAFIRKRLLDPPWGWRPSNGKGGSLYDLEERVETQRILGPLPIPELHSGTPPSLSMSAYCVRQAIATACYLDALTKERY